MSIAIKVRQIQKVFEQLENETNHLREVAGIRCLSGCGQCCTKPNIEASVLEFLPFAFDLFINRKTEAIRLRLLEVQDDVCGLYRPDTSVVISSYMRGACSEYNHRGMICRLFGYATVRDKLGKKQLSTCKLIKSVYEDELKKMTFLIESNQVPNYVSYFQKMVQIDFRLGQEFHPINKSILRAIEEVEQYYQYRPFPYRHRRSA